MAGSSWSPLPGNGRVPELPTSSTGVDRDLVDVAGEEVAAGAAPGVVAADPPVAGVGLRLGLRVRADGWPST